MVKTIRVNGIGGHLCTVRQGSTVVYDVHCVKQAVETTLGIPPFVQRLILDTAELSDHEALPEREIIDLLLVRRAIPRSGVIWLKKLIKREILFREFPLHLRANKEVVLAAVRSKGVALKNASPFLKADKEVALTAIQQNDSAIDFVAEALFKDIEFAKGLVRINGGYIKAIHSTLRADREVAITAVRKSVNALYWVPDKLSKDREFVKDLVSLRGDLLQWASRRLQSDRDVVSIAVRTSEFAHRHIAPALLEDLEFVQELVSSRSWNMNLIGDLAKINGEILGALPEKIRADRHVAIIAIRSRSSAVRFVAPELSKDSEFFKSLIGYASTHHSEDVAFVRRLLSFKSEDLDFVKGMMNIKGEFFDVLPLALRGDRDVAMIAVRSSSSAVRFVAPELLADREFVKDLVRFKGDLLQYAHAALRGDHDVAIIAVQSSSSAVRFVAPELLADREFVKDLVSFKGDLLEYAHTAFRADRDVVRISVRSSCSATRLISTKLLDDLHFIKDLMHVEPEAIRSLSAPVKNILLEDQDFALSLLKKKRSILWELPRHLRFNHSFMSQFLDLDKEI